MSHNMKLQLHFMDRIGIVADIADVMTSMHMNIISMEVKKREIWCGRRSQGCAT